MAAADDNPAALRSLQPDDLLRREELGPAVLSPDGRRLAWVLKRARTTATFHKYDFLDGNDRGDVWIVDTSGGAPQNLTNGAADGAGWWAPTWSPDSRRLALLSTRGGNVHVWVCDVDDRGLRRLCDRAADLHGHGTAMVWTSDRALLAATLAEDERPVRMAAEFQAAQVAMSEWPKAWDGQECTASVIDSGVPVRFDERPQGALVLIDALSGVQRTVMRGFFRELEVAPDRRHVACMRLVDMNPPHAGRKLGHLGLERRLLAIVTIDGDVVTGGVREIEAPHGTSLRWSPDGTEVALIGEGGSPEAARRVFRYRLADGRVRQVTGEGLHPKSIVWTAGGGMLIQAKPVNGEAEDAQRADWWLVAGEEEPRNVSADVSAVPGELVPQEGREAFVGLVSGNVMRLTPRDGRWENVTEDFEPAIVWLLWPRDASAGETFAELVLAVDDATGRSWRSLDLDRGELTAFHAASTAGWLADYAPEHDIAVPVVVDRTGTRLWLSRPAAGQHTLVVETNTWLAQIAEGEVRSIDYKGLDGADLRGWLVLPPGHEQGGGPYPMITEVYPGWLVSGATPPMMMFSLTGHHAYNPQLLAARGYAVLLPSMPLGPEDEPGDPHSKLMNGVMPAIDKAIELGIADPDRLGLIGHSFGGYATYGLIAQTGRFGAAVAMAGLSDLTSLHGQFDVRFRYDPYPQEHMAQMSLLESGQPKLGVAPWEDPERYVRNSPLYQAGSVETPVLIIQGDMDYVPVQQGEQFFGALYRQGKRARFARYWGEGHVFQSPANIRDMWERIYDWFDELL